MGTCYSFVSTEKIKDLGAFSRKLEHNFRIGGRVPNADPMKSYLNEELIKLEPGSDYIKEYNKRVLDSAYYQTHKIRKDAVRGIEVMMTLVQKIFPKILILSNGKKKMLNGYNLTSEKTMLFLLFYIWMKRHLIYMLL